MCVCSLSQELYSVNEQIVSALGTAKHIGLWQLLNENNPSGTHSRCQQWNYNQTLFICIEIGTLGTFRVSGNKYYYLL